MLFALLMWGVYRNVKQEYEAYKMCKRYREIVMQRVEEEMKYAGFHA